MHACATLHYEAHIYNEYTKYILFEQELPRLFIDKNYFEC